MKARTLGRAGAWIAAAWAGFMIGVGGVAAPLIFGRLIESGSRQAIFGGYVFAAFLMFAAAVIAWLYAINAERKPLEEVAAPLSAVG